MAWAHPRGGYRKPLGDCAISHVQGKRNSKISFLGFRRSFEGLILEGTVGAVGRGSAVEHWLSINL